MELPRTKLLPGVRVGTSPPPTCTPAPPTPHTSQPSTPLSHPLRVMPVPPQAWTSQREIVVRLTPAAVMPPDAAETTCSGQFLCQLGGFCPPFFDRYGPLVPGLGARFLNLGGKTERTAKKRGKNEQRWARNGLKRVGAS